MSDVRCPMSRGTHDSRAIGGHLACTMASAEHDHRGRRDIGHRTSDIGRARNAFTILELLLVLVILAVLAGIVGSRFVGQSQSAKVKAATTQLGNFKLALDRFEISLGRYPTSSEGLRVLVEKPSGDNAKAWEGPYLDGDAVPKDQWETPWNYRHPGQHRPEGYDLWSNGPDQREGGGDDISNWTE